MGLVTVLDKSRRNSGSPGRFLSVATMTSTPLLIIFVARLKRGSTSSIPLPSSSFTLILIPAAIEQPLNEKDWIDFRDGRRCRVRAWMRDLLRVPNQVPFAKIRCTRTTNVTGVGFRKEGQTNKLKKGNLYAVESKV